MELDTFLHTVNQIIDANIDNDALFEEVCNLSKDMQAENSYIILPSTSSSCEVFNNNLSLYWKRPGSVSIAALANHLIVMSEKYNNDGLVLINETDMVKFQVCLCQLTKIKYKDKDIQLFSSMLLKTHLQIEIMWQLHFNEILSFDTFMESKLIEDNMFKDNLLKDLASLFIGTEKTYQRRQSILSGFIVYFVKKSFRAQLSSSKKIFVYMLDRVLKDFLDSTGNFKEDQALPTLSQLDLNFISEERIKKYSRHAISQILSYSADQKVTEVLKLEMDWKSVNVFGTKRMLLTRFFESLECKEILEELASCFDQSKINASTILTYLSVMCIVFPLSATEIKEYIQAELSTGLENSDFKHLSCAFLIARQSALVCQDSFGSYNSWFEATFNSTSCSLITSRPRCSTLMKFLTSLVPTDDIEYLKVHTLQKPMVPAKCGDLLDDYILLAKTRLKDLKSPGFSDDKVKMNDTSGPAEEDVQKILSSYEETGKIPSSFFRAWMFRKPYFLEKFLPTLLKPRCLPDIPDTRMKLIDEVFKSVKLDPSLFKKYTEACEKEKQAWMEGIFSLDDEDINIMIPPPKDQLHVQLTKYCELLTSGSTKKVSETLNSVVEAVSGLLPSLTTESITSGTSIQVDLAKPLSSVEKEFVQELTGVFQSLSTCSKKHEMVCLKSAQGMRKLFSTLSDHFHQFPPVLCRHIILTLTSQPMSQPSMIKSLAWAFTTLALSVHKKVNEVAMTTMEKGQCKSCVYPTFQETLYHFLTDEKRLQWNDWWRFWVCYALFAVEYFEEIDRESQMMDVAIVDPLKCTLEDVVQEFIVKDLQLIAERFDVCVGFSKPSVFRSDWCETSQLAHTLFSTDGWQALSRNIRPSLTDWIEFELKIDAAEDNLPRFQRATYLWKTSCNFLTSALYSSNTSTFCSDIITLLAKASTSTSYQSSETFSAFVSLLTRHIYQLPFSNNGSNLWLVSVLKSAHTYKLNALLRIICSLPPYLVFCNSLHEHITQAHIEVSLSVVKQFSVSDHNIGGFFTLDSTIYFLQSYSSVLPILDIAVQVDAFISQPFISLSILVHFDILNSLFLLKDLDKEKLEDFSRVIHWAESVLNGRQESKTLRPSKNWLKAGALFAKLYNMTSLPDVCIPENLIKSEKESILFFLQITAVWLAMNGNVVMKQHSMLERWFLQVVGSHGTLLIQLLNSSSPELTSISTSEGTDQAFSQLRDFNILQLVSKIPAHTLVKSTSENLTLCLLTAFSNILTIVQNDGLLDIDTHYMACETTLSNWMRQLVDSCSSQHLHQVHLYSPSLNQPGPHVALYLYIDEKKRQR